VWHGPRGASASTLRVAQGEVLIQQGGPADQKSTQEKQGNPQECHRSTFRPLLGRQILRPNGACGK